MSSHATWCHSKSCEGDCGNQNGFSNARVTELEAEVKSLKAEVKRLKYESNHYTQLDLDTAKAKAEAMWLTLGDAESFATAAKSYKNYGMMLTKNEIPPEQRS